MSKRRIALLALLAALLALAFAGLPVVTTLARMVLVAVAILALLWALGRLYRRALWKVGRRLAFSYFLIGVVPIPLALLLLGAAGYLGAGFLLGHVYRDAVASVRADLEGEAAARLALARAGVAQPEALRVDSRGAPGDPAGTADGSPAGPATGEGSEPSGWALYRGGRRTAGDPRLPAEWPGWAARAGEAWFVAGPDQAPSLAAAAGDGAPGAIALWPGDLAEELRERAGVWVDHLPPSADTGNGLTVDVGDRRWTFQTPPDDPARKARAEAFFAARRPPAPPGETGEGAGETAGDPEEPPLRDRPLLFWGQLSGPVLSLADGAELHPYFFSSLRSTPRGLAGRFQSPDETGLDAAIWGALLTFAFLLFDAYAVAAVMAAVMIFALSRAFNRLSSATQAVRAGDFSVRIPVKRRDQVGELQRSFNGMTQELEHLVATAAEKEVLEKELAIARELQRSLLPRELPGGEAVEFATLFAPSAAIGGDYFDVLGLGDGRLAVVIADVSGHGLPSGLRMAMLKAALTILVEAELDAEGILGRLRRDGALGRRPPGLRHRHPGARRPRRRHPRDHQRRPPADLPAARRDGRGDPAPRLAARRPRPRLRPAAPRARTGRRPGLALRRADRGHRRGRPAVRLRRRPRGARGRRRRGATARDRGRGRQPRERRRLAHRRRRPRPPARRGRGARRRPAGRGRPHGGGDALQGFGAELTSGASGQVENPSVA